MILITVKYIKMDTAAVNNDQQAAEANPTVMNETEIEKCVNILKC